MKILAVDTQSNALGIVLIEDDNIRGKVIDAGRTHSETLLPEIDSYLKDNHISIHDIDMFAVDVGPGSFTGIRIGVNTINGFGYATGKEVIPFTIFDVLSSGKHEYTAIDCKHGNYYVRRECDKVLSVETADTLATLDVEIVVASNITVEGIGKAVRDNINSATIQAIPEYVRESEAERNICIAK